MSTFTNVPQHVEDVLSRRNFIKGAGAGTLAVISSTLNERKVPKRRDCAMERYESAPYLNSAASAATSISSTLPLSRTRSGTMPVPSVQRCVSSSW